MHICYFNINKVIIRGIKKVIRNIFTLSLLSLSLFSYNTYADIAIPEQPGLTYSINRNPEPGAYNNNL